MYDGVDCLLPMKLKFLLYIDTLNQVVGASGKKVITACILTTIASKRVVLLTDGVMIFSRAPER